jgi:uncharacterized protein (UPF0128 family)
MNETALPLTDERGRTIVEAMSDSEKLAEILHTMRAVSDALESLGNNPMLKAMMPGGIGF